MTNSELILQAEEEFRIFERMSADTGRIILDRFKKLTSERLDDQKPLTLSEESISICQHENKVLYEDCILICEDCWIVLEIDGKQVDSVRLRHER